MSKLSLVIDEMIACGEGMIKAANALKELFSRDKTKEADAPAENEKETSPAAKNYTKEEVRGILAGKSAKGFGKEVKALLLKYGADKLSALSPDNYAAVVADAEGIGNE